MKNLILGLYVLISTIACSPQSKVDSSSIAKEKEAKVQFQVLANFHPSEGTKLITSDTVIWLISLAEDAAFINSSAIRLNAATVWYSVDNINWEQKTVDYPLSDRFFASCVSNDQVILIDSMTVSNGWSEAGYALVGYDKLLSKKLFSVYLQKGEIKINSAVSNEELPVIAIPDYEGLSNTRKASHEYKLVDLSSKEETLLANYTIGGRSGDEYESLLPHSETNQKLMVAFNVRHVRNEGKGNISLLKVFYPSTVQERAYIQIKKVNYVDNTSNELLFAPLPEGVRSSVYCHRILDNHFYISASDKIFKYVDGRWEKVFELESRGKILDFIAVIE